MRFRQLQLLAARISSEQFKQVRNRWLRAIRKVKRECWERFLQASDPSTVWKSINAKPQQCAIPSTLTSPSGDKYCTITDKMEAIASISFPTKTDNVLSPSNTTDTSTRVPETHVKTNDTKFTVCPKLLKRLLRNTSNSSSSGLDGIGWQQLKMWFFIDPLGLCELINHLVRTGLPPELKLANVVVISKPGRRDRASVNSYRCI
jgi:hypothetical protein